MALRYYQYIMSHHWPFSVNNDADNNSAQDDIFKVHFLLGTFSYTGR